MLLSGELRYVLVYVQKCAKCCQAIEFFLSYNSYDNLFVLNNYSFHHFRFWG